MTFTYTPYQNKKQLYNNIDFIEWLNQLPNPKETIKEKLGDLFDFNMGIFINTPQFNKKDLTINISPLYHENTFSEKALLDKAMRDGDDLSIYVLFHINIEFTPKIYTNEPLFHTWKRKHVPLDSTSNIIIPIPADMGPEDFLDFLVYLITERLENVSYGI